MLSFESLQQEEQRLQLLRQEQDWRREEMRREALRREAFLHGFSIEYVSFLSKSKLVLGSFPAIASMLSHCAVLRSTTK